MAVSDRAALQSVYASAKAQGKSAVVSDAAISIEGYGDSWLMISNVPWPSLTTGEAIPVPLAMGVEKMEPGQAKISHSGAVTIKETQLGAADDLLIWLLEHGGTFKKARLYEGIPDRHTRVKVIRDGMISVEAPAERDWESRTETLKLSGTMTFHYLGEDESGNVDVI